MPGWFRNKMYECLLSIRLYLLLWLIHALMQQLLFLIANPRKHHWHVVLLQNIPKKNVANRGAFTKLKTSCRRSIILLKPLSNISSKTETKCRQQLLLFQHLNNVYRLQIFLCETDKYHTSKLY